MHVLQLGRQRWVGAGRLSCVEGGVDGKVTARPLAVMMRSTKKEKRGNEAGKGRDLVGVCLMTATSLGGSTMLPRGWSEKHENDSKLAAN